ncbi:MAG TPA: DUF3108 domain-containing protein [Pyrinomonadaceae bacterium]|nr:DUF3108 domain-containing protein [Pyrinomonadaceae bacterium]
MFRRILLSSLLALSALLLAIGASADQNSLAVTRANFSLPKSEELVYQAELSRALIRGLDVAEFRLTTNRVEEIDQMGQPKGAAKVFFNVDAVSKGLLRKLFGLRFHQHIESTVESGSFLVMKTKKLDEQGDRRRESETVYDRSARRLVWTERDPNDPSRPPRVVSNELNEETQDLASLIYYLRAQPLVVGQSFEVLVNDSGRIYRVPVKVAERKKIKSVIGEIVCLRVEPEMFGDDRPLRGNGQISIWLTDDENRIPVQASIKTSMGTLNVKLKSLTSSHPNSAH